MLFYGRNAPRWKPERKQVRNLATLVASTVFTDNAFSVVQDLLGTLEKWLVTVCAALLDLYDACKPAWITVESALHFGSTTSIPLPYKEFIAAAYMLMSGTREKIESVRTGAQRRVTL